MDKTIVPKEHHGDFMVTYAKGHLTWQLVEQALFMAFSTLVNTKRNAPIPSAIYHTLISFNSKVEVIDACLQVAYKDDPRLIEWADLQKKLLRSAKHRNRLAHSTLKIHTSKKRGAQETKSLRLAASLFDMTPGEKSEYTLSQMKTWLDEFTDLSLEVSDFAQKLGGTMPLHRQIDGSHKKSVPA